MSESPVYGIDLGTTYSCISYVDEHGKPVVIPNADNDLTTPSVVYFESTNNIVVGDAAKEISEIYPLQVVSNVKRVMGDEHWSFEYGGTEYTPQEISSFILRKIIKDAEINTGQPIENVVITVPAYFGINQKETTKQAGELAGLNVLYVIPEPTAAAIAYGMEQKEDQTILVYDLGGGTFDITVIEVKAGAISVICTGGDHHLGGKNWDEELASYFAQCFAEETGKPIDEVMDDLETWQELMNTAEKCKRSLSQRTSVLEKVSHDGERVKVELSREKFEEITASFLERTISLTKELLDTAKAKGYSQIDKLLLVGGSTYMPQVEERLNQEFSFEISSFDPNQAVAKGAAIFGYKCHLDQEIKIALAEETGIQAEEVDLESVDSQSLEKAQKKIAAEQGMALPGLKKLTETKITNVTSKSFGVVTTRGVVNLITIDDAVPRTVTDEFSTAKDDQGGADLKCVENTERLGPDDDPFELDPAQVIGEAHLQFTRGLPEDSPIEITYTLSPDGLLSLHAKDLTTQQEVEAEFQSQCILSQDEFEKKKTANMTVSVSS